MNHDYPTLFSPLALGPKTLKNRIWMTAHSAAFSNGPNHEEAYLGYFSERVSNHVAAITVPVHQELIDIYDRLVPMMHAEGALLIQQAYHPGRQSDSSKSRKALLAPSAIPDTAFRETPHAMTKDEIAEMVESFATQALSAVENGLDGVEIHGVAHGYLVGQFLSPVVNHRTDEYGGSFENRMRFLNEICTRVRQVVPKEMVFGIRLNGSDGEVPGGLGLSDWQQIAAAVVAKHDFDYVSVSKGNYWETDRNSMYATPPASEGYEVDLAAGIKSAVGTLPVIAVGRIMAPRMAEDILTDGKADIIGMARSLIADPQWASKTLSGHVGDIRPCVGLNLCLSSTAKNPMACVTNPAVGRETSLGVNTYLPTATPKKVAIVGGGPAGLRAALTASWLGHDVSLFEAQPQLGGQVKWLSAVPSMAEVTGTVDWMEVQLAKSTAKVATNHRVTAQELIDGGFEHVILATGSVPVRHGWTSRRSAMWFSDDVVPGIDQPNVCTMEEVFVGGFELQGPVLVYDDLGARQAIAVAEYFANRQHPVEIVTPMLSVGRDLDATREQLNKLRELRRLGVTLTTQREIVQIDGAEVSLKDVFTDEVEIRNHEGMIVLVTGNEAVDGLAQELEGAPTTVTLVGDCLAPRRIFNAIWEGEMAGRGV